MPMYDPPHPGEMLRDILEDEEVGWTVTECAHASAWPATPSHDCSMAVWESRHEWRWRWSESVGATQITGCVFRRPMSWRKRGVRVRTRPESGEGDSYLLYSVFPGA